LSAIIVAGNAVVFLSLGKERAHASTWVPAIAALCVIAGAATGGHLVLVNQSSASTEPRAGILQYHQDRYRMGDFTLSGLGHSQIEAMEQVLDRMGERLDLLVLPESVGLGAVSLDGSRSSAVPPELEVHVRAWEVVIGDLIGSDHTLVALGTKTSRRGRSYNSMLFFTSEGLRGVYHKRRLVPFAEQVPGFVRALGVGGSASLTEGTDSAIVKYRGMAVGAFICQEVLFPETLRQSVRDGAEILISGGNDGVFADPAVALIHARIAQVRAVETGRYIVRSMTTGISAIIDPTGSVLQRSGTEPVFMWSGVAPRSRLTPYARLGDWTVWCAMVIAALLGVADLRCRFRGSDSKTTEGRRARK
jgi:apolipoprotein N-acyltransferase